MRRADGFEPVKDTGNPRGRLQVDRSELTRMADAVSALERPSVHGNLAVRTSLLGVEITSRGLPFWAKITGLHDDGLGTTCYSWQELWDDGAGNFALLDNGRKGDATTPINQAYEVTKSAVVPTDGTAIVIMWLSYSAITYEFTWPGGTATTFTAPVTFTAAVTFTGPLVFTWTSVTLFGEVKFPTTTSVSVAPTAVLIVPTLIVGAAIGGGPPTYSSTVGALICDGKYLWQNGGITDWYGYWPIKSTDFATSIAVTGGIPYLTSTGTLKTSADLLRDPTAKTIGVDNLLVNTTSTTQTGIEVRTASGLIADPLLIRKPGSTSVNILQVTNTGLTTMTVRDTVTNTAITVLNLTHSSSGTPNTNYGVAISMNLDSTTTAGRQVVTQTAIWTVATDASRRTRWTQNLVDSGGTYEMIRGESDGTAARTAIGGGSVVVNTALVVYAPAATYTVMKVQAAATPSVDVFMVANSSGTAQVRVDSTFKTWFVAGTTAGASMNIPEGVAPTSPVEGDLWYDGTHLYFEDSSGAVDLLDSGGGGGTTSTNGQVAVTPGYGLTGSYANITGATFTAPATGTYLIQAQIVTTDGSSPASDIFCKLRNTTAGADLGQPGETKVDVSMTIITITMPLLAIAALTSGDVVDVQGKRDNGGTVLSVLLTYVRLA